MNLGIWRFLVLFFASLGAWVQGRVVFAEFLLVFNSGSLGWGWQCWGGDIPSCVPGLRLSPCQPPGVSDSSDPLEGHSSGDYSPRRWEGDGRCCKVGGCREWGGSREQFPHRAGRGWPCRGGEVRRNPASVQVAGGSSLPLLPVMSCIRTWDQSPGVFCSQDLGSLSHRLCHFMSREADSGHQCVWDTV